MSDKYKIRDPENAYFLTLTTVNQKSKVWQNGNQAKELYNNKFIDQKIIYIHNNPIKQPIVENPEDY